MEYFFSTLTGMKASVDPCLEDGIVQDVVYQYLLGEIAPTDAELPDILTMPSHEFLVFLLTYNVIKNSGVYQKLKRGQHSEAMVWNTDGSRDTPTMFQYRCSCPFYSLVHGDLVRHKKKRTGRSDDSGYSDEHVLAYECPITCRLLDCSDAFETEDNRVRHEKGHTYVHHPGLRGCVSDFSFTTPSGYKSIYPHIPRVSRRR